MPDGPAARALAPRVALLLLTAIYTVNFIDRQIITIVAAPVRDEFSLDNFQFGLLGGFAFALFYSLLGLPIARLADRGDRVRLLAVSCALWSVMTAACGAATSFAQLLVARMLVGVGEAACTPASHSLISDFFAKEKRPRALAVFALGIPLGTLAGLALGGAAANAAGWRGAFFIAAVPGLALALALFALVRDPTRPGRILTPRASGEPTKVANLIGNRTFRRLCGGAAVASMSGYGLVVFLGLYFKDRYGLSLPQIGLGLGLAIGVGGALGVYAGGAFHDRFRNSRFGPYVSSAAGLLFAAFVLLVALAIDNALASFIAFAFVAAFNAFWYGPVFAGVQAAAPEQHRASAAAMLNLIVNLVGLGLGPPFLGFIADRAGSSIGLDAAIAACAFINIGAAAILLRVR